ncbi:MAG: dihydrodipicolinate synthase family protein [Acidimicrobiia bacterium]|nr:dihydrodipicolinate synthase family protein [Acidimicrobiia bacterium]
MQAGHDMAQLSGLVAILPTPLTAGSDVDEGALTHLVEHAVASGLDGVVVLGSNGEFPYMRAVEKHRIMAVAAEAARGCIPVVGTASAYGTDEAVDLARAAAAVGCDAVMAALPLYFDVGVDGAVAHMQAVAEEGGLPVFYYHFPGVTGLSLTPEEIGRIAAVPGIVGAKITVTNVGFLADVIAATASQGWRVFTGTSFLLDACVRAGGAGVFCPLPLVAPRPIRDLYTAARSGDVESAHELQVHVCRAIPLLSGLDAPAELLLEGFEAVASAPYEGVTGRSQASQALFKETLRLCGHPVEPTVRRPYTPATAAQREVLERTLVELGWIE